MNGREIADSKPVSISEVVKILEENSGATPTYEQQVALEHAKKVTEGKNPERIRKALEGLNLMTEASVIKVLEIMPKKAMTIRHVLAREKRTYSDEDIGKVLELTKSK